MTIVKRLQTRGNLGATREKSTQRKYHLIREIVSRGDAVVSQIASEDNLTDPFIKGLAQKIFDQYIEGMGVRCIAAWL